MWYTVIVEGGTVISLDIFLPVIEEQPYFLGTYRAPFSPELARRYILDATREGDLVLDPFCRGASVVIVAQQNDRRAIAVSFSPLDALVAQAELQPPPPAELDTSVARLAGAPKLGTPLRHHLLDLYRTTCRRCGRPTIASYFVWDKAKAQPIEVHYRCKACGHENLDKANEEDQDRLTSVPISEFHRRYVLDRLGDDRGKNRNIIQRLLDLYTQRNLYAITTLVIKAETLFAGTPSHEWIRLLLLHCLDRGSNLHAFREGRVIHLRDSLRVPRHFVERNVWYLLEDACRYLKESRAYYTGPLAPDPKAVVVPDLFSSTWNLEGKPAVFVGQQSIRRLAADLPKESVSLVLTRPPCFEPVYGPLTFLWGGWLYGRAQAERLQSFLRHRTPDWSWYVRAMGATMSLLRTLIRSDGLLVLLLRTADRRCAEAMLLAAAQAELTPVSLLYARTDKPDGAGTQHAKHMLDYRLALRKSERDSVVFETVDAFIASVRHEAVKAACELLQQRGEPVTSDQLHAFIWQHLAEIGLLRPQILETPDNFSLLATLGEEITRVLSECRDLVQGEEGEKTWWLAYPPRKVIPLGDRVERVVREILGGRALQSRHEAMKGIYERFPGPLAPEPSLVNACLDSYGRQLLTGHYTLRLEDRPEMLRKERREVLSLLSGLGARLDYDSRVMPAKSGHLDAEKAERPDVVWEMGEESLAFFWQGSASLQMILHSRGRESRFNQRYIIVPTRRTALLSYKIGRSSFWSQAMQEGGWAFIKSRHLQYLAESPSITHNDFSLCVGLDPLVEHPRTQLMLF